ncbi:MAG: HlyC/CorC family transporter [Firmicutes bacterium]|nr:HlyC/CorC family transporter [Bacillota bacterium]
MLIFIFALASGAEAALSAVDKTELEEGRQSVVTRIVKRWWNHFNRTTHALRLSQIVTLGLGGLFLASYIAPDLTQIFIDAGMMDAWARFVVILIELLVLVLGYGWFGWLIVRRWAMHNEWSFLRVGALLSDLIRMICVPVSGLFSAIADGVLRLCGISDVEKAEDVTEDEIRAMVDLGSENGSIDQQERTVINNVLELENKTAEETMTHRTDMQVLWMEDNLEAWNQQIEEANHTRLLVCGEDVDDVVGTLFIKDFYIAMRKGLQSTEDLRPYIKEPYYVPESVKIDALLKNMQKSHHHFAVVIDEYGGVSGVLTINDLLEQLVGEIGDGWNESEPEEPDIVQLDENTWRIKGTTPLRDMEVALDMDLPDEDYDTLGGMIFDSLESIPDDGEELETLTLAGLSIKVGAISAHRIEWAKVCKLEPVAEEEENEDKD